MVGSSRKTSSPTSASAMAQPPLLCEEGNALHCHQEILSHCAGKQPAARCEFQELTVKLNPTRILEFTDSFKPFPRIFDSEFSGDTPDVKPTRPAQSDQKCFIQTHFMCEYFLAGNRQPVRIEHVPIVIQRSGVPKSFQRRTSTSRK